MKKIFTPSIKHFIRSKLELNSLQKDNLGTRQWGKMKNDFLACSPGNTKDRLLLWGRMTSRFHPCVTKRGQPITLTMGGALHQLIGGLSIQYRKGLWVNGITPGFGLWWSIHIANGLDLRRLSNKRGATCPENTISSPLYLEFSVLWEVEWTNYEFFGEHPWKLIQESGFPGTSLFHLSLVQIRNPP